MKKRKKLLPAPVICALLLSAAMSFGVFGAVNYDSSTDPVVAFSGMQSYVTAYVAEQLNTIRASITSGISGLSSRLDTLADRLGGAESDIERIDGRIDALETAAPAENPDISAMLSAMEDLSRKANDLEARIGTLEEENSALNSDAAGMQKKIDDLEGRNSELSNEIDRLKEENSGISDDAAEMLLRIGELETLSDTIRKTAEGLKGENADLSAALDDLKTENENLASDLTAISERLASLGTSGTDLDLLRERCRKISAELDGIALMLNGIYSVQTAEPGAVIKAAGTSPIFLILRSGNASVAFSDGVNDLSEGWKLNTGAEIPVEHNILISGNGAVTVTSAQDAVFLIGGEFEIVSP